MRREAPALRWRGIRATALVLALAAAGANAEGNAVGQSGTVAGVAKTGHPAVPATRAEAGIDRRVQLLAKELDLDARQQLEVRKILVQQRADIRQAWADENVPAEVRVATTRAIGNRTADRIRAILNDAQREKYIKPQAKLPEHPQQADKVESWINAVGNHPQAAEPAK